MMRVLLALVGVLGVTRVSFAQDLTGIWRANDGGTYYIRQVGNSVWWVGLSQDDGRTFTNVFHEFWRADTAPNPVAQGIIEGEWADVPRGRVLSGGRLRLSLQFNGEFWRVDQTEGFSGSVWRRAP